VYYKSQKRNQSELETTQWVIRESCSIIQRVIRKKQRARWKKQIVR